MARIAEHPGHSLPGSYEGLHRHSRAHQAIAAAAGSSLSAPRRWHKQGCAGTALQPCPAHGYPCVPCTGGLVPTLALHHWALAGGCRFPTVLPAQSGSCSPHPAAWLDEAGVARLPRPQQECRSHGFPWAWSLLCPSLGIPALGRPSSFLGRVVPSRAKAPFPAFSDAGTFSSSPYPPSSPAPCLPGVPACHYQLHLRD